MSTPTQPRGAEAEAVCAAREALCERGDGRAAYEALRAVYGPPARTVNFTYSEGALREALDSPLPAETVRDLEKKYPNLYMAGRGCVSGIENWPGVTSEARKALVEIADLRTAVFGGKPVRVKEIMESAWNQSRYSQFKESPFNAFTPAFRERIERYTRLVLRAAYEAWG